MVIEKELVPKLRFNGFSDEWEQSKLGELFIKGGSGGTPKSTNKDFYDGDIPFLSISDITNSDGIINSTEKHINELGIKNSSAWIVPKGSISLAMYASVGKLAILNIDASTSQAFYNMVFDESLIRDFVYQRLGKANVSNEWNKLISTGTQSNLNAEKVKKFEIKLPTEKKETGKITSFLMNVDNLITFHKSKLENLENTKKGLLQKMFPKNNEVIPNIRFKNFTDDWEQRKLGEISTLGSSKRVHREDYVETGIPFFRGLEISKLGSSSKLEDVLYITEEYYKDLKDKYGVPQIGDILITAVGTLGNPYLISDNMPFYFKDGNLIWLRDIQINPQYLNIYLGDGIGKKRVLESAAGSNQKALTMAKLQNVEIFFPSKEEQIKIGKFFSSLDNLITLHQRKLQNLEEIKKGLLQQMFI